MGLDMLSGRCFDLLLVTCFLLKSMTVLHDFWCFLVLALFQPPDLRYVNLGSSLLYAFYLHWNYTIMIHLLVQSPAMGVVIWVTIDFFRG